MLIDTYYVIHCSSNHIPHFYSLFHLDFVGGLEKTLILTLNSLLPLYLIKYLNAFEGFPYNFAHLKKIGCFNIMIISLLRHGDIVQLAIFPVFCCLIETMTRQFAQPFSIWNLVVGGSKYRHGKCANFKFEYKYNPLQPLLVDLVEIVA
jgi:hypothetical protein